MPIKSRSDSLRLGIVKKTMKVHQILFLILTLLTQFQFVPHVLRDCVLSDGKNRHGTAQSHRDTGLHRQRDILVGRKLTSN